MVALCILGSIIIPFADPKPSADQTDLLKLMHHLILVGLSFLFGLVTGQFKGAD